jgi:hypothetical protein
VSVLRSGGQEVVGVRFACCRFKEIMIDKAASDYYMPKS